MLPRIVSALLAAVVVFGQGQARGQARPLTIAAASDLRTVFPDLVAGFERETATKVTVTFGSSGTFFAQIQNCAPYDLFFSADVDYPRQLAASGYADAGTLYQYATGRIVLWTRKDSGIDISSGLAVLRDPRVRRIAIANPKVAPYGRAAEATLRSSQLYEAVQSKLVLGDNIAQTAQFADSGNADVAIIAHSLALGPELNARGMYFEIPPATHAPIEQAAIIITASKNRAAAERFLTYLKGPQAQVTFRKHGFANAATAQAPR